MRPEPNKLQGIPASAGRVAGSSVRDIPRGLSQGSPRRFLGRIFEPVDVASLAYFRVAFGLIMVWEVCRYFQHGWIPSLYVEPAFHFTYYGFGWVQPWPGIGMYLHFIVLGVLAAFIALGFFYRVSAILFFLGFTYVFLLEQAQYLNHFYFVCLVALIMIFVPAHRAFSLDAWRRPEIRSETTPLWAPALIAAQMGIVYFYGGIAKLNADWLRGEPVRYWVSGFTDQLGGPAFAYWAGYLFAYGGLLFDLFIVPLLLWPRTRMPAFVLAVGFHLTNAGIFNIGIFPWFAIAASAMFFPPSWPRQALGYLRKLWEPTSGGDNEHAGRETTGAMPGAVPGPLGTRRWVIVALLGVFMAVQLLVPLRHFLHPGNVHWTQEGHRFAWHMMLRNVSAEVTFYATDPESGRTREIAPESLLTEHQTRKMSMYPDMILQAAHKIAEDLRERGYEDVEVSARVDAALNGRAPQPLVDPTVDLAAQPRSLAPAPWILPLEEPLPARN